jgi:ribonuclease E
LSDIPVSAAAQERLAEEAPSRSSYFSMPVEAEPAQAAAAPAATEALAPATAPVAPVAPVVEPVVAVSAPAQPAAPVAAPSPVAAPVPAGLPKVLPFQLSIDEMNQVAQASGLEWVNSNADKVAQVQAAIAAEPKPIHVPREPRPAVVIDEGPLVLVETRKDLRNTTLPFEETQQG